jgi:D-alanine-D-alanine ligase
MSDFYLAEKDLFGDFPLREKKDVLRIGVIAGGISSEREVSLSTGNGIFQALKNLGYNATFIDFNGDLSPLMAGGIEIAYIALHGKFGEDGTIQGLLELLKIPYTGSGVLSSAAAMDKIFSKKIFGFEKIPTPDFIVLDSKEDPGFDLKEIDRKIRVGIGYPVIVKPNKGGSSIGVTILENGEMLQEAIDGAFKNDNKILIEKYLKGKLLTVSIIGDRPVAMPVVEIRPKSGFYDYRAKYTPGCTDYIVPAEIDSEDSRKISEISLECHKILGCRGISRVDLIMTENSINVLEVNTIPGMTPTSLVPKSAGAAGISFELLVDIILNSAGLEL